MPRIDRTIRHSISRVTTRTLRLPVIALVAGLAACGIKGPLRPAVPEPPQAAPQSPPARAIPAAPQPAAQAIPSSP